MLDQVEPVKNIHHIGISIPENLSDSDIESLINDIHDQSISIKIHKHPVGMMYMSLEWAIPTFFAVYILKPYFDSFLKEAGKDHYSALKNWLKVFAHRFGHNRSTLIAAEKSPQKLGNYNQSLTASITFDTKIGIQIKLLLDCSLSNEYWDTAIEQLADLVFESFDTFPDDPISKIIEGLDKKRLFTIYAIIDKETKTLRFYDDNGMFQLHKKL